MILKYYVIGSTILHLIHGGPGPWYYYLLNIILVGAIFKVQFIFADMARYNTKELEGPTNGQ